jgi:hypothetical protein
MLRSIDCTVVTIKEILLEILLQLCSRRSQIVCYKVAIESPIESPIESQPVAHVPQSYYVCNVPTLYQSLSTQCSSVSVIVTPTSRF